MPSKVNSYTFHFSIASIRFSSASCIANRCKPVQKILSEHVQALEKKGVTLSLPKGKG
jgi:hypothetical protein